MDRDGGFVWEVLVMAIHIRVDAWVNEITDEYDNRAHPYAR